VREPDNGASWRETFERATRRKDRARPGGPGRRDGRFLDNFPRPPVLLAFAPPARTIDGAGPGRPGVPPLPTNEVRVQLLIAVINQEEKLDEILSGLVELGVTGATIISSEGMGRVLSHDIPIFAGLDSLASFSRPQNQTIFSVIREEEKVEGVLRLLQEICGNLEAPATGIAFTIPVNRVVGLAPELGEPPPRRERPPPAPGEGDG
jgi:nitrogen regulatory protein P-II 1